MAIKNIVTIAVAVVVFMIFMTYAIPILDIASQESINNVKISGIIVGTNPQQVESCSLSCAEVVSNALTIQLSSGNDINVNVTCTLYTVGNHVTVWISAADKTQAWTVNNGHLTYSEIVGNVTNPNIVRVYQIVNLQNGC